MSKPVKQLLQKEVARRLTGAGSLAVVGFTGIDATATNAIRGRLREKNIRMTVVKNSIARQAFRGTGLDSAIPLLDGPCALVYGADPADTAVVSIVRELLDIGRQTPNLAVKGAVLEGETFGAERVVELSRFPTREEAIGRVVSCALYGGGLLAAGLLGPASRLAGLLKAVQERQTPGDGSQEGSQAA